MHSVVPNAILLYFRGPPRAVPGAAGSSSRSSGASSDLPVVPPRPVLHALKCLQEQLDETHRVFQSRQVKLHNKYLAGVSAAAEERSDLLRDSPLPGFWLEAMLGMQSSENLIHQCVALSRLKVMC